MRHFLSVLLAVLMTVGLLAAAIYIPATADWVMRPLMTHFAPPEDTGFPAVEYAPVADMITGYLSGDEVHFQYRYMADGIEYSAFNQKEQQHMEDVRALFSLCRSVMWGSWGIALVLLGGMMVCRKLSWRAFRGTLIALLALVAAVIVAAVIDFDSLFILFHRIAFTNDLWLLDPRTDLLIRLMPLDFFISYAAIIGGIWLLGMVALLVVSTISICKAKKGSEIP